ncbi:MAG TPA: hypothetical protein VML94_05835 [Thermoplasmata archaeon]|nr:hypothetical protein [Thermoplasmata archaeon]
MPHGEAPAVTIERVIWKRHRMDVLQALARRPAGMRYTEIQYEIVRSSATDLILQELKAVGLVEWRDEIYYATPSGKKIASVGEVVAEVGSQSTGNGGAGGR